MRNFYARADSTGSITDFYELISGLHCIWAKSAGSGDELQGVDRGARGVDELPGVERGVAGPPRPPERG